MISWSSYLQSFSKPCPKRVACRHPGIGVIFGFCVQCGKKIDDESDVTFGYIHKNLKLSNEEIARLRDGNLGKLPQQKKICLILDLDHTLLNSCRLSHLTAEEEYLKGPQHDLPDALKSSLYRLDSLEMMIKLRPFVRSFLKEASKLFEMYICTMGGRGYALQMAMLLDPGHEYFNSRVISKEDCRRKRKGVDVVLGRERPVLILDDREDVWRKEDTGNLILVERYHFFASSCRQFGLSCKSLSQLRSDESEADGALATILRVLQRIHSSSFDPVYLGAGILSTLPSFFPFFSSDSDLFVQENQERLANQDIRQVLKTVRNEVLRGCKIVISSVFPFLHLWKMAEQLGATCSTKLEPSVTHVVTGDGRTKASRWAVSEKKFLVHPRWIEAAFYLWEKKPEENYSVNQSQN